jgi:two-component system, OmpR family, sensor kinase
MKGPSRLRDVRTRLLLAVLAAVTVALAAATIGFNLLLVYANADDADSLLRQRADAERAQIAVVKGRIHLEETFGESVGDSHIWIFEKGRAIEQPRAHPLTTAAALELVGEPSRFTTVKQTHERLYSLPIKVGRQRYGTIVAGLSLSPYEQTERSALLASLAFAAVLLLVSWGAARWLLRSALEPVAEMTVQAEAWSEKDLDRRFAKGEPYDDLSRLAFTLDRLLDRIAASLRHERRFSAELSHELRTPLAKVTAEAELALRRTREPDEYRRALEVILTNARHIDRIVDTLFAAARQEAAPRGLADAGAVARAAVESCAPMAGGHRIELALDSEPLRIGVDADLAERILYPVLDNACRYGHSNVKLSVARDDGSVLFTVTDDGPGVPGHELETIFEPAARGAAGRSAGPSAGLGLALARRLARSVSGDVQAAESDNGGRFVVRLPTA